MKLIFQINENQADIYYIRFSSHAYEGCSNVIFIDFGQVFDNRDGSTQQNI